MGRSLNKRWDRGRRTRSGRKSPALRHQIALVKLDLRRSVRYLVAETDMGKSMMAGGFRT